jgi:CRISPR system Cascade subunit CasE
MSDPLFLSRLRLRRDTSLSALAPVLAPDDVGERVDLSHRLLWAVFSDSPDRRRDFLWREEDRGRFLVLSHRRPIDAHGLFEVETKPFEPILTVGDRLYFALRVNAVITKKNEAGKSTRNDLVMDRLKDISRGERAKHRDRIAHEAGSQWLMGQGIKAGFGLEKVETSAYSKVSLPRGIEFGVIDLNGVIKVENPDLFLLALTRGFGKAKGFGCGLMLIRRA